MELAFYYKMSVSNLFTTIVPKSKNKDLVKASSR